MAACRFVGSAAAQTGALGGWTPHHQGSSEAVCPQKGQSFNQDAWKGKLGGAKADLLGAAAELLPVIEAGICQQLVEADVFCGCGHHPVHLVATILVQQPLPVVLQALHNLALLVLIIQSLQPAQHSWRRHSADSHSVRPNLAGLTEA